MRKTLAVVLPLAMLSVASASAQGLRVEATRSPSGAEAALRAGALYVSNPSSEWLYADLAFEAFASGVANIRPHRDIYLVGPAEARILPPDQRTYRENLDGIRAMMGTLAMSEGAAKLPVRREFPRLCRGGCGRHALWTFHNVPERVISLRKGASARIELLFQAPSGTWAAGDYVLTIDGPGDSVTELPVRIE